MPTIELIIVPYDVDRDDTATAKGPRDLLALGFEEGLTAAGFRVRKSLVWSRAERGREAIVVSVARETGRLVARARSRGRFPLILAGGCLVASGVVSGLQRSGRTIRILWVDAHGDFNTPETTPSGYWDGMSLAVVCGRSLDEVYKRAELRAVQYSHIAHLGARALDPPEREDFERLKILQVPPTEVASDEVITQLRRRIGKSPELYLHVDMDGIDPRDAPAVTLPEPHGIPLADLIEGLGRLPSPRALTLAGMNFERVDDKRSRKMLESCLELATAVISRLE